jgi:response regulator RpfG family c-di-GMP phosphodiesterase
MSHQEALAHIVSGRGSHFDPAVVDAFVRVAPAFEELSMQSIGDARRTDDLVLKPSIPLTSRP